jgi:hypothetical protein
MRSFTSARSRAAASNCHGDAVVRFVSLSRHDFDLADTPAIAPSYASASLGRAAASGARRGERSTSAANAAGGVDCSRLTGERKVRHPIYIDVQEDLERLAGWSGRDAKRL